jgi:thiamine pyrophosphokinase
MIMSDNDMLMFLQDFIASRTRVIRKLHVISDIDLAELFETGVFEIQNLTETHISSFKNDSLVVLNQDEQIQFHNAKYAYTDQGIFIMAGAIKSKRSIRIYVSLIELLVNRLQNRAYEIATTYQSAEI